jgi:hypothetical protein
MIAKRPLWNTSQLGNNSALVSDDGFWRPDVRAGEADKLTKWSDQHVRLSPRFDTGDQR